MLIIPFKECHHYWNGDKEEERKEYIHSENRAGWDIFKLVIKIDSCRLCGKEAINIIKSNEIIGFISYKDYIEKRNK